MFIRFGDGDTTVAPAMRNAELIESRPMFVRVHVRPETGFTPRQLRAVLSVVPGSGPGTALEERKMIAAASDPEKLETTFNFLVPAALVKPGAKLSAAIYETGAAAGAEPARPPRFPAIGELELAVKPGKMVLDVVMVPAVGMGGMVDDAPARRKRLEDHLYDVYPVQKVNVRWREPLRFTTRINAAAGFRALAETRMSDGAPVGTYYHLLVAKEDTTEGYLGIANLAGATANDGPRRIGITFLLKRQVDSLLDTVSHEMGHNHGRNHAPGCNAAGVDMAFPYGTPAGPGVGVHGYSLSESLLKVARLHKDLMGYCNVTWVSDYTWKGFERRVRAVSALAGSGPNALLERSLMGFISPGDQRPHWVLVEGRLVQDAAAGKAAVALEGGGTVSTTVSITTMSDHRTREIAVNLPTPGEVEGDAQSVTFTLDGRPVVVDLRTLR